MLRPKARLPKPPASIADTGYHRRDGKLAELEDVLAGQRRFAELPPRA